ncbi:MAG: hypothetical protein ABH878_10745 [bacterium]
MKILIDPHTLRRAEERGASREEITDVINSGFPVKAKFGRTAKVKVYPFNRKRHGKHYA